VTANDDLVAEVDSGWASFYRSMGLYEVLPSFVALGHGGDAAAADAAFQQTSVRGGGVSVKVWGDLKGHQHTDAWKRLAREFEHPRSVCRFADLAWCADPRDQDSAQLAISAYRDCALAHVLDECDSAPEQMPASRPDGTPIEPEPDERWIFASHRLRRARQIALVIRDAVLVDEIND